MKKRKTVKIVIALVIVAGLIGGGIFFLVNRQPSKEVTVVPVSNVYTTYWGDSQTLDGYVTTGSMQEIYMTEGGFDKVAVKEGQQVRKGDVLVEFDSTQADLTLRGDLAKVNLLKSQIAAFEEQVSEDHKKIRTLQKALDGEPVTPPDGTSPATPTVLQARSSVEKINVAVNYGAEGAGTKEKPFRILCTKDAAVKPEFWATLPTGSCCFVIDIYSDAICTQWIARWTVETLPSTQPTADWKVTDGLVFETGSDFIIGFDAAKLPAYGALTMMLPEDLIEKLPVGEDETEPPKTAAEIEAEIKMLREDIDSCKKQIEGVTRDLRQAQITYEKNKLTLAAGKIVANIDGVVATLGDSSTPVGEVFLRLQGESRFAVTLYVNELLLREVTVGTTVQLMCYESGTMAPAVVTEINTEPVENYYSGGNANASTYQVTAELTDPQAQPRLGEWCQATLDAQSSEMPSDAIYLPMYLIREDDGGQYVMRTDENERLQKQYVITGKSLWGSYTEIKQGVTLEDRLAFPYGKTVREGAPAVDGDYFY